MPGKASCENAELKFFFVLGEERAKNFNHCTNRAQILRRIAHKLQSINRCGVVKEIFWSFFVTFVANIKRAKRFAAKK